MAEGNIFHLLSASFLTWIQPKYSSREGWQAGGPSAIHKVVTQTPTISRHILGEGVKTGSTPKLPKGG